MGPETREINQPENVARMGKPDDLKCQKCGKPITDVQLEYLATCCHECWKARQGAMVRGREEWDLWRLTAQDVDQIRVSGAAIANRAQKLHQFRVDARDPYPPHRIHPNDLESELHEIDELAKRVLSLTESLRRFLS